MRVLVTGSEGNVGKAVVGELTAFGHSVVGYDIKLGDDIHDRLNLLSKMEGCDVVVHLAAIPGPEHLRYRRYFDTNVAGTLTCANVSKYAGVKRFILSSSTGYYGLESSIGRSLPIGDETSLSVLEFAEPSESYVLEQVFYGASKVCCENVISPFGLTKQMQIVILRFAPMPSFYGLSLSHEKAAEAVRLAAEYPGELWLEKFNICSSPGLDCEKAKKVLGWMP